MYSQESRAILFKLSLRKMDPTQNHPLLRIVIRFEHQPGCLISMLFVMLFSYTNTLTGVDHKMETVCSIRRPQNASIQAMPAELDKHINRFTAAGLIASGCVRA